MTLGLVMDGKTSAENRPDRFPAGSLLIFDLDGTLYFGDHAAPGGVELIDAARAAGYVVRFLTNNSTRTRAQIYQRLVGLGFHCEENDVYACSRATAQLLADRGVTSAYCVGTPGLLAEMAAYGIEIEDNPDAATTFVAGLDPERASCADLPVPASSALFVACNRDADYPGTGGALQPGCGALVDTIERLANRCADVVVGKPESYMLELVALEAGIGAERTVVIGDSWASDVRAGLRFGAPVLLVGGDEGEATSEGTPEDAVVRVMDLFEVARLLEIDLHDV